MSFWLPTNLRVVRRTHQVGIEVFRLATSISGDHVNLLVKLLKLLLIIEVTASHVLKVSVRSSFCSTCNDEGVRLKMPALLL